jgi:hypothetical protein
MYITNGGNALRLKDTTFILNDKPMRTLLWCDVQKRAKRNKPAKLNGVLLSEVAVFHEL